jgi:hypothetical protein
MRLGFGGEGEEEEVEAPLLAVELLRTALPSDQGARSIFNRSSLCLPEGEDDRAHFDERKRGAVEERRRVGEDEERRRGEDRREVTRASEERLPCS